ncbi:MAG: hypothetical protein AB1611_11855 [bacterium]
MSYGIMDISLFFGVVGIFVVILFSFFFLMFYYDLIYADIPASPST